MWDTHELAWAAGFFDGEGCCSVFRVKDREKPYSYTSLQISQSDIRPLERFKAAIGSCGHLYGPHDRHRPNTRPEYTWRCNRYEHVQAVIALLWKYLSPVKRNQIKATIAIVVGEV